MRAKIAVLIMILLVLSVFIIGCGEDEPRTVSSSKDTSTKTTTQPTKTTKSSASTLDAAVEQCGDAEDHNSCYLDAVLKFKGSINEQNTYAFVNVCKRIIANADNPAFVADDFDWEIYPTLRLQCFREIQDDILLYGKAEFIAKELCDDLEGYGISSGDSYKDYCYIEVADARKSEDTQGAEELCYTMSDSLMRRHCCQTVYGKNNNNADYCTKVLVS
ncbi:hypothetical protein ACFL96_13920 [Thermoproteota archaeon]